MFNNFKKKRASKRLGNVKLGYLDKRTSLWKPLLVIAPALIVIIVFTIIPFITTASKAFEYLPDKHDKTTTEIGFRNWAKLFEDPFYQKSIQNSMLYALISVPLILFISILISGVLASIGRKWLRGIFQTVFFLPYVTSAVAISLSFAYIFDYDFGILNAITGKKTPWLIDPNIKGNYALASMVIYGTWRGIAFNVLILTTAMLGVDKTLYKSASIDGANGFQQFFSITLPSINRTLNFLITMGIIGAIKVFPLALFNNDPSKAMLHGGGTLLLYIYQAVKEGHIQIAGVSSIILLIISISFSIVFKNGVNLMIKTGKLIGERNVSNKIKIKTMMR